MARPRWESIIEIRSKRKFLKSNQLALPSLMALDLVRIQQSVAVRLITGPEEDLGQIASSAVSIWHREITVLLESSTSMPSLFGELKLPKIVTSLIDVVSHPTKCKLQSASSVT